MVRVISVHHFQRQQVSPLPSRTTSSVAIEDVLVVAKENCQIDVFNLFPEAELSHSFPTVDVVSQLCATKHYLAALESSGQQTWVRVYTEFRSKKSDKAVIKPRIVSKMVPAAPSELEVDVIELPQRAAPLAISSCCSTANLIVTCDNLIIVYVFRRLQSRFQGSYIDFFETLHVFHAFTEPRQVCLVENVVACMSKDQLHIFRVETKSERDSCDFYSPTDPPSLVSVTSPESPDDTLGSETSDDDVVKNKEKWNALGYVGNVKDLESLVVRKHLTPAEIHASNCDYGSTVVSSATFDFSLFSPDNEPNVATTAKFILDSHPVEAICVSQVHRQLSFPESEPMLRVALEPVYWPDIKMRERKQGSSVLKNPLVSEDKHGHLMSLMAVVASRNEAHLFHIPAHRRGSEPGDKYVGRVQRTATVAFTSPMLDMALDSHLLHVLTQVGLETYTLSQLGFYALWEAQNASLARSTVNALPVKKACDVPVCLVGMKNFPKMATNTPTVSEAKRALLLSDSHLLLLIDGPENTEGTLYSLTVPAPTSLQTELLQLAEVNKGVSPQGYFHLLCEAFFTLRLHRLRCKGLQQDTTEMDSKLEQICLYIGDFFLPNQHRLALTFYRMSKSKVSQIFNRSANPQKEQFAGLVYYISQVIVHPKSDDERDVTSDANLMDKVIALLSQHAKETLVELVILSPSFRAFKSATILEAIEIEKSVKEAKVSNLAKLLLLLELQRQHEAEVLLHEILGDDTEQLVGTIVRHADSLLVHWSSQTLYYSDFATLLRKNRLSLFVAILVRAAHRSRGKLDLSTILSLELKSPLMSTLTTINLVLFLEEYFLLWQPQREDESKALRTLLQCYLTLLSGEVKLPDDQVPALKVVEFNSSKSNKSFVEELRRCEEGNSKVSEMQRMILMNAQSLLLAFLTHDPSLGPLTMAHIQSNPSTIGQLSLNALCLPWQEALTRLVSEWPQLCVPYLRYRQKQIVEEEWKLLLKLLHARLTSAEDETHTLHEAWYSAMQEALDFLASNVNVDCFERLLPNEEPGVLQQEEFHNFLQVCKKKQQTREMETLIADTATQLLKHIND